MVLLCCAPGVSPLTKSSFPVSSTYDAIWARAGAATAKHVPANRSDAQMQLPSMDLGLIVCGPWGRQNAPLPNEQSGKRRQIRLPADTQARESRVSPA